MNKCGRCEKTVYPTEELKCLDKSWHKSCFKCDECGMALSMKNYKGFNKTPYCSVHCPQVKPTVVADTPEARRLAENTRLQSQVKYHEEFEKAKGKLTQVADDPETVRVMNTHKIISNISYHGDIEKKKQMEQKRTLGGSNDGPLVTQPNNHHPMMVVNNQGATQNRVQPMMAPNQQQQQQQYHHQQQQQLQRQPQYQFQQQQNQQQAFNQQNIRSIQSNSPIKIISGGPQPVKAQHPVQQQQQSYHLAQSQSQQARSNHQANNYPNQHHPGHNNYPINSNQNPYPQQNIQQSSYHNQVAGTVNQSAMRQQPNQQQQQQQPIHHPQQQSQMTRVNPPPANNQQTAANPYHHVMGQQGSPQKMIQQQQPQQPVSYSYSYGPHSASGPAVGAISVQQNMGQVVYQQQQQAACRPLPTATALTVRAMYDYTAQDVDEVSFLDGDLIVACIPIDEGWMTGTVQRTGQRGMLPANYVEPCQ